MKTRLPLAVLIVLLFTASSIAEDSKKAADKPELTLTEQHFVCLMGSRIGWQKTFEGKAVLDEQEYDFTREEVFISITRNFDNATFNTSVIADTWQTSTGAPVKVVETTKDAAQTKVMTVNYSADKAVITTVVDKGVAHKQVLNYDGKKVLDSDEVFLSLSASGKLKAGFEHSFLTVDTDSQSIVKESWKVIGQSTQLLLDGTKVEGLKIKLVKNGNSTTVIVNDDSDVLFMDTSSGISMEVTKKIPEPFKPEPVVIESVMKSNLAIMDEQSLTELEIQFNWKHDDEAEDIPQIVDAGAYHDVARLEAGFAVRMKSQKLGEDFELAYPLAEVAEDVKVYLKATPSCQSDDKVLAGVAAKLLKGKTDARKLAEAISDFVDKRLKNESGTSGAASAKQAYDEQLGDCTEHSVLFVALARAAGLPARNVGGIVYVYDSFNKRGIFGYHAWAEVWLGKWVPVDATVGEVGTSARYIMMNIDEPGNSVGEGRLGRCIRQKLKPEVIGYKKSTGKEWRKKDAPEFEYESGE